MTLKPIQTKLVRYSDCSDALLDADLPDILQRIYANRGLLDENQLNLSLSQLLPFNQLKGIDQAGTRLYQAIKNNERLLIIGDYDADGATSTALGIRVLKAFGAKELDYLIPNRFQHGYGLSPAIVKLAQLKKADVIITVDNGIASVEGVELARSLAMDVIITDHHLAGDCLPNANVIVNPNQPDCPFPSKNLAGVGVLFYVLVALRAKLRQNNWFTLQNLSEPNMANFLDLVALGTVADVVELDHNNRILVHQGLKRIRAGQCVPGVLALIELSKRQQQKLTASDIGFALGPRINAAGRLEDMTIGVECLLAKDYQQAMTLAEKLHQLNAERRHIEQDMQQQALKILQKLTFSDHLPAGICLFDSNWHQGVIGILASRIKDHLHRPVIIFAKEDEQHIKGSARSIASVHIRDILANIATLHPEMISKFGGHAMAAGLTIPCQHFESFAKAFSQQVALITGIQGSEAQLLTDGSLTPELLTLETAKLLQQAGPWGKGFPEPLFDGSFTILDQRLVGDKHLKLKLTNGVDQLDAIAFFINANQWPNYHCEGITIAYRLSVNDYQSRQQLQLIIEHLEPTTKITMVN